MKLRDVSVHVGHWPFRRLPYTDSKNLLREMDRLGVETAATCNTHSILYKNAQSGNEELFEQAKNSQGRLLPVATLNPRYVGWQDDLKACVNDFGMKAVRLVPPYHDYSLTDPEAIELAAATRDFGLAVFIPCRIVDVRQRHWLDTETNVQLQELVAFAQAAPDLQIVATEFPLGADPATIRLLKKAPNVLFEFSRIRSIVPPNLPQLVRKIGRQRLLYGSGMPFKVPESALLRLAMLEDRTDRDALGEKNFKRLFGLK